MTLVPLRRHECRHMWANGAVRVCFKRGVQDIGAWFELGRLAIDFHDESLVQNTATGVSMIDKELKHQRDLSKHCRFH